MSSEQMWALLVGFVAPPGISVLQQPHWSARTRALLTLAFCMLAGTGTAYWGGHLDGRNVLASILVVLVTATTTYRNLWHPVGISPAIELATSPKSGRPPGQPVS